MTWANRAAAAAGPRPVVPLPKTATPPAQNQNQQALVHLGQFTEKDGTMGYVKYVTDKVQDTDLRSALTAHGELTYFDINRQKNCAFVEYKTVEGYQAAVASNPHTREWREHHRGASTPQGDGPTEVANYGSGRGNASGRGRGGSTVLAVEDRATRAAASLGRTGDVEVCPVAAGPAGQQCLGRTCKAHGPRELKHQRGLILARVVRPRTDDMNGCSGHDWTRMAA
ncbi:hypothetical protein G6O67_003961 [Ophiocordyceps sinensis]|uniref:RRM domain-containing protein n=1 Tax=Ophiocordyceps sinensis TaxID=72228 RepID=A0A8H4LXU2_9HYPO|nr:hypothetical protein G6O67_003961 [Ophiocordyceps sinensis]